MVKSKRRIMKRIVILFILFISFCDCYSQNEGHKRPVYCDVMGYNFLGVGKVKVQIDLGRKTNSRGFDSLYDEDGKKLKFNTMIAVLNYMSERGWRTIDNYYISSGNSKILHFLLEKWIISDEEITEGLILKEDEPYKGDDMY